MNVDKKKVKIISISVLISSMIINYMMIINRTCAIDGYQEGHFFYDNANWHLSLGRWAVRFISKLTLNVNIPLLVYFISACSLIFCVYVVTDLFEIKEDIKIILVSILTSTCLPIVMQCDYNYIGNSFSLAAILSVASAYLMIKKPFKGSNVLSILFISIYLGCYQSYIGVTAFLLLASEIINVANKKHDVQESIKNLVHYIAIGILGCLLYLIILKINLEIFNVNLSSYGGADQVGVISIFANLGESLKDIYSYFFGFYFGISYIAVFFIPLFILFAFVVFKLDLNINNKVYAIVMILLSPITLNLVRVIATGRALYPVMGFQNIFFVPFAICIIDLNKSHEKFNKYAKYIINICLCFVCLLYSIKGFSTQYSRTHCEQVHKFYAESVISQIWQEYGDDYPIVFIGTIDGETLQGSNPLYNFGWGIRNSVIFNDEGGYLISWPAFIREKIGIDIGEISSEQYNKIINTDDFKDMNCYPSKGSIELINDIVVVKINNPN